MRELQQYSPSMQLASLNALHRSYRGYLIINLYLIKCYAFIYLIVEFNCCGDSSKIFALNFYFNRSVLKSSLSQIKN